MRIRHFAGFCGLVLFVTVLYCSIVPITGRRQLSLVPESQMLSMSFEQYDAFLKANKLSTDQGKTRMVKTVGVNIEHAVEQYFTEQGMEADLANYKWEFNLIDSEEVNAWCMPGGKVVVYSGLIPVAKDEAGLAVVVGHEIAHAIAGHGAERMSQGLLTEMGGLALATALQEKPAATQQLWMTAFGLGAQVGVMLPFSRLHETEADRLGLVFMAMAGYNPESALEFWQRMSAQSSGQAPPQFLSTHPADATRIANIKKGMPEAMKYFNARKR